MCPATLLSSAFICGRALMLSRNCGSELRLPMWEGSGPWHILRLQTRLAVWEGSDCTEGSETTICLMTPNPRLPAREGFGATACSATHEKQIKKYSATTVRRKDSHVTEERSPRTEATARRAGRRRHHDLQRCTCHTATVPCYSDMPPGRPLANRSYDLTRRE
jgi:hypothetical protein